ncbi:MAG: RNA polymerase sigma factor [Planctomycetota bacterium]
MPQPSVPLDSSSSKWDLFLSVWCAQASQPGEWGEAAVDSDVDDVAAALGGDHGAFERIVARYQSTMTTQMLRFSRERSVVESLVQDTFVEAFVSLRTYRGKAPLLHWLRRIAVRVGYRFWKESDRERKRAAQPFPAESVAATDAADEAAEAADRLHGHLGGLAPRDRLVLTLLYWEDLSVAEIANLTGWSQAAVKVQLFRARRRLKRQIERAESDQ